VAVWTGQPGDPAAPAESFRLRRDLPQKFVSFFYLAYGIGIESTIPINGLDPLQANPSEHNLRFESDDPPDWVRNALQLPSRVRVHRPTEEGTGDPVFILTEHGNAECHKLSYSDGAEFVVSGAMDRVWGAIRPPYDSDDLATYFLGPILGFVLRQRNVTCLHASAVEMYGQAIAFSGDAGYGKSTTAGALALRGIPVLAEDIVPLKLTKDEIEVVPGYPRVCLWPDAVAKLVGREDALPRLTAAWDKRFLALDGVRGKFSPEKRPLGLIYVFGPRSHDANAPRIEELSAKDALMELVQKTYMNWLLDRERRAAEFDELSRLVTKVPVRRIIAHCSGAKIGELCELIESDAGKILHGANA
jgi:hypothetical protein